MGSSCALPRLAHLHLPLHLNSPPQLDSLLPYANLAAQRDGRTALPLRATVRAGFIPWWRSSELGQMLYWNGDIAVTECHEQELCSQFLRESTLNPAGIVLGEQSEIPFLDTVEFPPFTYI